jgi:hypothetical protein
VLCVVVGVSPAALGLGPRCSSASLPGVFTQDAVVGDWVVEEVARNIDVHEMTLGKWVKKSTRREGSRNAARRAVGGVRTG